MILFILGILRIIGIVLLCLLLLLLLIAIVVLFVPIRYMAEGEWKENNKQVDIKATWLGKIIRFKFDYNFPNKTFISLKVFWIDIIKLLNREKKPKKIKKNSVLLGTAEAEDKKNKNQEQTTVMQKTDETDEHTIKTDDYLTSENEPENKKEGFEEKINNIIFKFRTLYDKIRMVIDNISYYLDILEEKETQQFLADAWITIKKILIQIKPNKYKVDAIFGFETPDITGRVYGYYCMISPLIIDNINIEPDFEDKVLTGEFYMTGRITLFCIIKNALRIIFDKRLKPLVNKLKNGGKKNG